jgi:hypothetical protein
LPISDGGRSGTAFGFLWDSDGFRRHVDCYFIRILRLAGMAVQSWRHGSASSVVPRIYSHLLMQYRGLAGLNSAVLACLSLPHHMA